MHSVQNKRNGHLIIHCPTSEWPSFYDPILDCSKPQCTVSCTGKKPSFTTPLPLLSYLCHSWTICLGGSWVFFGRDGEDMNVIGTGGRKSGRTDGRSSTEKWTSISQELDRLIAQQTYRDVAKNACDGFTDAGICTKDKRTDRQGSAPWSGSTKNRNVSTGPLARAFARLLAPLTRLLAPPYSLCLRTPLRSLARSLTHFAHSRARGKVNDWMAIYSVFFYFGP